MRILISAAEASSDAHGANLLRALRGLAGSETLEVAGIGGPLLQAEGLQAWVDARELLSMGFSEILGRLPRIFRVLDQMVARAEEFKPDVVILMDYPDFHLRLAARLKKQGVRLVYYIPPKVWVWRR